MSRVRNASNDEEIEENIEDDNASAKKDSIVKLHSDNL